MRIGIHTQKLTTNYGGILQNYALQTILRKMGHEVWTFDIVKYTWGDWGIAVIKTIIKKILGRKASFPMSPNKRKNKQRPLRTFVHKYINLTTNVKRINKSLIEEYGLNALLVGSDQVWRPIYNSHIEDMFFGFVENQDVVKIAYAASFGTNQWEYSPLQTSKCAKLAKLFKAISVREDSGVDLCRTHLGVQATHVLDPTLLLTPKDYNELCKDIPKHEPFVFAYILDMDERKIAEIKTLSESHGLPYFIKSAGPNIETSDSIELWLSYFRDAAYVITDSFHGTAFSINYNKDFLVFDNVERGNSRFESLLNLLNLKNRVVKSVIDRCSSINWNEVNQLLNSERQRCQDWLKKSLS